MTLVETIIAIIVLGIAIPPLANLYTEVARSSVDHTYQGVALGYAESLLEEIVSKDFEDPDEAAGSFGTEENDRQDFDDLDDFDGLSNSPPIRFDGAALDEYSGFTRVAVIDNVTAAVPDPGTPENDGSTEFKRIKVTVSWLAGKGGAVTLSTLRADLDSEDLISGPLDVPASIATIERKSANKFKLDLVSISPTDVVIGSFELSADVSTYDGHRFKLDHKKIWHDHQGASLPTGVTQLNEGNTNKRTVEAGDDPSLEYQSHSQPSGTIAYTLVLHFTNGASSTLNFSVAWTDDDDDDDDD